MPTYHPSFSFLFCPRLLKIADRETSSVVVRMEMIYLGLCIDVAYYVMITLQRSAI